MKKPLASTYNSYYQKYIDLVDENLLAFLVSQQEQFNQFIHNIPEAKGSYCYAVNKWSIKGVLAHINDTERIFAYRALTFARNDQSLLPGYDENEYNQSFHPDLRTFSNYLMEFNGLRASNIALLESLTAEQLNKVGNANGNSLSCSAAFYIIAGHLAHHQSIIISRYLK